MCSNKSEILENLKDKNIIAITNGLNPKSNRESLKLSEICENVKSSLGFYPMEAICEDEYNLDKEIEFIEANSKKIIAIGEIGMDFKECFEDKKREKQKEIFKKFVNLAIKINKPIIVHSRKAEEDIIKILEESKYKKVILHCFSANFKLIKRAANNEWFFSIPTSVKYNEHFQKIIEEIQINQLFCETDSPFLHPIKLKNNTPLNISFVYEEISRIKRISLKEVESMIEHNFKNLFLV